MATRRKAKRKAGGKRKKARVTKAAARKKTARKSKTTQKKAAAKKKPGRHHPIKPSPTRTTVKSAPVSTPAQPKVARPTSSRPSQPISREQRIGVVTHYYSHQSVATMRLEPGTTLHVGDVIHIHGHTTDFIQKVESLEVNHTPITEVGPNDDFGLKVIEHAREHDVVFKVRS